MRTAAKPKIGDDRYLVEMIDTANVLAIAKKNGWVDDETEGLREFCEPEDAAVHVVASTLDEAKSLALRHLRTGLPFYGACIIDHQTYEAAHDDRGNLVRGCPPEWETDKTYEITADGDCQPVS